MRSETRTKYPLPLKIRGVGRYLPRRLIPSSEIERRCQLPEGWCRQRQGVAERRWVDDETVSFIGAEAARDAIRDAGMTPSDVDLILSASNSFDRAIPEQSAQYQHELGLGQSGVRCLGVNSGCLSFIVALQLSAALLRTGRCRCVLIVSSIITSADVDYTNVNVCTMLGDGAAAVVVTLPAAGEAAGIHAMHMETYSRACDISGMHGDLHKKTMFTKEIERQDFLFDFDPQAMQSTGMLYSQQFMARLWPASATKAIRFVIPNQTSRFNLDMMKFTFPAEKIVGVIDRFGNCGAVGYPLALYKLVREEKQLNAGDLVLMTGMGGGFSLSGVVFSY